MNNEILIQGSPSDIGTEVYVQMVLPVIIQARGVMDGAQMAQLYAGVVGSLYGSIEAEFGKEAANEFVEILSESYRRAPAIENGAKH